MSYILSPKTLTIIEGKFVRIADMILIDTASYFHIGIVEAAFNNPDTAAAAKRANDAATEPVLKGSDYNVNDAGHFYYVPGLKQFNMGGHSTLFGAADHDGRAKTIQFAQRLLGHDITVVRS